MFSFAVKPHTHKMKRLLFIKTQQRCRSRMRNKLTNALMCAACFDLVRREEWKNWNWNIVSIHTEMHTFSQVVSVCFIIIITFGPNRRASEIHSHIHRSKQYTTHDNVIIIIIPVLIPVFVFVSLCVLSQYKKRVSWWAEYSSNVDYREIEFLRFMNYASENVKLLQQTTIPVCVDFASWCMCHIFYRPYKHTLDVLCSI